MCLITCGVSTVGLIASKTFVCWLGGDYPVIQKQHLKNQKIKRPSSITSLFWPGKTYPINLRGSSCPAHCLSRTPMLAVSNSPIRFRNDWMSCISYPTTGHRSDLRSILVLVRFRLVLLSWPAAPAKTVLPVCAFRQHCLRIEGVCPRMQYPAHLW